jgi:drug/metabolite transporter (DMT)-like permease
MKDDDSSAVAQTIVFMGIEGVIAIIIAVIRGKFQLSVPPSLIINFVIIAVFMTLAYVLKYRGFKLLNASEVSIFSSTSKMWNVLGAAIFLHEAVTPQRIIGTVVILLGITITIYVNKKFQINKGILFVLAGALLFGLTDINGYYILQKIDASNYQIYASLLPVFALLLIQPTSVKKIRYYFRKDRAIKVTLLSLFDTFGMLALFLAYQAGGKASIIGPLSATKIIVTVFMAMIFLKERTNITNKILGALVSIVGVILLL